MNLEGTQFSYTGTRVELERLLKGLARDDGTLTRVIDVKVE